MLTDNERRVIGETRELLEQVSMGTRVNLTMLNRTFAELGEMLAERVPLPEVGEDRIDGRDNWFEDDVELEDER